MLRALERTRRGLTIGELRQAIDEPASERTVYRDAEQLCHAGFPLTREGARWRLLGAGEGAWSVPLDPTHILALTLTEELLAPLEGSYLAEPLSELRTRLQATLTPAARGYAAELGRTAIATLFAPGHYAEKRRQLATIHEAIEKQQLLIVHHQKPGHEPAERKVAPYATWYASGKLYLVGHCHTAGATRRFAVARIVAARVTDETFEPDPSFDINAFVEGGFGVYGGEPHEVVIAFDPEVAHLPRERRYHKTQRLEALADGRARLTMRCGGLPEIAAWLAGFGGKARPLAPAELVAAVKGLHRAGLAALAGGDGPTKGRLAKGRPAKGRAAKGALAKAEPRAASSRTRRGRRAGG